MNRVRVDARCAPLREKIEIRPIARIGRLDSDWNLNRKAGRVEGQVIGIKWEVNRVGVDRHDYGRGSPRIFSTGPLRQLNVSRLLEWHGYDFKTDVLRRIVVV